MKLAGTYVVECKGFSTTDKAALVAGVLNPEYTSTNGEPMMIGGVLNRTTLSQTSNMTADEQTRLHIGEMNMDYAGKEFYEHSKYTNSVIVVVPQSAINANNGSATIRLGVMVGSQTETAAQTGEWTVFDDFRLLYASKNTEADLILDQDRADLNYIYKINEPLQNKTLRLNKTFTAHKWNTLVLPVNLTLKQLRDAFGSSTRLAELELLTESGIQFKSVDFTGKADDYVALQAYKPYLIIPEKDKGQAAEYTSVYVETGSSSAEYMRVKIAANHFVIPKVSLSVDDLKKSTRRHGLQPFLQAPTARWRHGAHSPAPSALFLTTLRTDTSSRTTVRLSKIATTSSAATSSTMVRCTTLTAVYAVCVASAAGSSRLTANHRTHSSPSTALHSRAQQLLTTSSPTASSR